MREASSPLSVARCTWRFRSLREFGSTARATRIPAFGGRDVRSSIARTAIDRSRMGHVTIPPPLPRSSSVMMMAYLRACNASDARQAAEEPLDRIVRRSSRYLSVSLSVFLSLSLSLSRSDRERFFFIESAITEMSREKQRRI